MLAAIKQRRAAGQYGIVLPANEFEPLVALALQQDDPILRDDDRYGNFRSAGFSRALDFYAGMHKKGYTPPSAADTSNVWNEFGRGHFVFYISGPWNIGEFKRRLPSELQQAWMTAPLPGPDVQRRFHALTGDLPPRRRAWHDGALADDVHAQAFREQLERVKPTPQVPEWERIANEIRLVTERVVHGDLTVAQGEAELNARTDRILEKRRWLLERRSAP